MAWKRAHWRCAKLGKYLRRGVREFREFTLGGERITLSEAVRHVRRFSGNWVLTSATEWPRWRPARQCGQSAMTVHGLQP